MLTLLIYLSLGLTTFGCSNMSNMITLSTGDRSEFDTKNYRKVVAVLQKRYGHRGSSEMASVNIIDLT